MSFGKEAEKLVAGLYHIYSPLCICHTCIMHVFAAWFIDLLECPDFQYWTVCPEFYLRVKVPATYIFGTWHFGAPCLISPCQPLWFFVLSMAFVAQSACLEASWKCWRMNNLQSTTHVNWWRWRHSFPRKRYGWPHGLSTLCLVFPGKSASCS